MLGQMHMPCYLIGIVEACGEERTISLTERLRYLCRLVEYSKAMLCENLRYPFEIDLFFSKCNRPVIYDQNET